MDNPVVFVSVCVGLFVLIAAYEKWIMPWLLQCRPLAKIRGIMFGEWLAVERTPEQAISFYEDCFFVNAIKRPAMLSSKMSWSDVHEVFAFKRDMFTVDCICLVFVKKSGEAVEVDEDMARWQLFVDELPRRLPGCKSMGDWYSEVAFPPFETNMTKIYDRENAVTSLS